MRTTNVLNNDTTSGCRRRSWTKLVLTATSLALASSALATAPAMAATSKDGCTVTAKRPVVSAVFTAVWADYPIHVKCKGGRTAIIEQERYEADPGNDDYTGSSPFRHTFWPFDGQTTKHSNHALHDTDGDGDVEIYHRVRFRVDKDGRLGGVSAWDYSPITKYSHF